MPALTKTAFVPSALIPPTTDVPFAAASLAPLARLTRVVVSATVSRTKTRPWCCCCWGRCRRGSRLRREHGRGAVLADCRLERIVVRAGTAGTDPAHEDRGLRIPVADEDVAEAVVVVGREAVRVRGEDDALPSPLIVRPAEAEKRVPVQCFTEVAVIR